MAEVPEWPVSTVSQVALERTISSFDTGLAALSRAMRSAAAGLENLSGRFVGTPQM
jgi:hypothetical protein